MTIATDAARWLYTGDGSTVSFSYTTVIYAASELDVYVDAVLQVSGFSVTGVGGAGGGNVTFDTAPANGAKIVIVSDIDLLQPTNFPPGGLFPADANETGLDRNVRLIQQLAEQVSRAAVLAATTPIITPITLPEPVADQLIAWNAAANNLANITLNSLALSGLDTLTGSEADDDILSYLSGKWRNRTPGALNLPRLNAANIFTGINTHNAQVRWKKGADIASAATLVLGTDGNYFDVTGNTGPVTAITVAAGTLFMLQLDSTPQFNHHATNLNLPGGANITAKAGDRLIGFAPAANQVHVLDWIRVDGRPVVRKGNILQRVHASDGEVATGTTTMTNDDSIPQNTEGDEYISATITPGDATNRLIIETQLHVASSAAVNVMAALFQDATANALASTVDRGVAADTVHILTLRHEMAAGTASATTFKVRAGGTGAGTTTFNGASGARLHGGVLRSTLTITETAP